MAPGKGAACGPGMKGAQREAGVAFYSSHVCSTLAGKTSIRIWLLGGDHVHVCLLPFLSFMTPGHHPSIAVLSPSADALQYNFRRDAVLGGK